MCMTKMGRPPLPTEERKAHMLRIRMTDDDREQINQAAETEGESASEWARQILLKAAKRTLK